VAKVRWTEGAGLELLGIADLMSDTSASYAESFLDQVDSAAALLGDFPKSGRVVPELFNEDFREVIVGPYRLLYRVHGDDVEVMGIVHGARDLRTYLGGR